MENNSPSPTWVFNLHDKSMGIPRTLAEGIQTWIFAGEQAMLSVVRFEPNSVGKIHSHPEEQWGVLLEGECVRLQGGEEVAMKVGDFWHTPGGVPHTIRVGAKGALVLDIFSPPRQEYKRSGEGFGQAQVYAEKTA
ncbi:MAG: cupin domain-containing protein [Cyanobacteria bacterium P01_F01_bin.86]